MFLSKRNGRYYLFYLDSSGKRRSRSTKSKTKSDALRFLHALEAQASTEKWQPPEMTLSAFADRVIDFTSKIHTPSTVGSHRTALNELADFLGSDRTLSTVSVADCERFLAQKTIDASAWTSRKYYLALAALFERARRWDYISTNPWRMVKRPRTPEVLPGFLTRAQFKDVISGIRDRDFCDLIVFAVLTGLRRAELLAMCWSWVDIDRKVVTVQNSNHFTTKGKRARVVPLCDDALEVLNRRLQCRAIKQDAVFCRKGKPIQADFVTRHFRQELDRAGLPEHLHFHSLRHTFASWLVQGGVSLFQVGKMLGHSSVKVTEVYSHLVPLEMHSLLGPLRLSD